LTLHPGQVKQFTNSPVRDQLPLACLEHAKFWQLVLAVLVSSAMVGRAVAAVEPVADFMTQMHF
jgi:hypothetical protein